MFLLMVLVSRATCEWVQISQQHYRKPLRTHNFPLEETTQLYFEETTKTNRIYLNHTIGAHTWNKGNVNKVPKLGNVQRVQLNGNVVKAPNVKVIDNNRHDIKELSATAITHSEDDEDQMNFEGIGNEHSEVPTNIERPSPNSIRVKNILTERKVPVHPLGKPLNKQLEQANDKNIFHKHPSNADMGLKAIKFQRNQKNDPTHTGSGFSNVKPNPLFITGNEQTFVDEVININSFKDLDDIQIVQANGNKGEPFIKETIFSHRKENKNNSTINRKDEEYFNNVRKSENPLTTNEPNVKKNKTHPNRHKIDIEEIKENENVEDSHRSEESSRETKPNTIENLMKFMTVISDTIRRNTRRGVNSKTRYLQNLKDTILANIEERMESVWPDDEPSPSRMRREARGHHLEIPPSESALMTISFLTFAVFLIKLVLQVIQTYKNKAMMVTPAVVATVGRATASAKRDHN